jgi:hypothetical protein
MANNEKPVYDQFDAVKHVTHMIDAARYATAAPAAPVILPEDFIPFEEDEPFDGHPDDEPGICEPDEDDMVPVYPQRHILSFESVRWIESSCMMFIPSSKSELDSFRESLKALPDGLKAVIYADLYNEGLRVSDVVSTDKKVGAAEKYIKEIES